MKNLCLKAICLSVILVVVLSLVPIGRTQGETHDYTESFLLMNHPGGSKTYELNISIPYSLYQYYTMKSHFVFSDNDYSQYITPYTLKPIADRLWQIYNNTEDFTNGVLMLVHQITYKEIVPGRYPVETFVAGEGDCDLFAYIAGSILEAGGIHAALLVYREQAHMEIGVDLGSEPADARGGIFKVTYQDVPYYVAECTGGQWRDGWRVGECPTSYQNASAEVLTFDKMEQTSIGQAVATLKELDPSTLAMQVSSSLMLENNEVVISGQILPQVSGENVTLQEKINSGGWTTIATVLTQPDGRFNFSWVPPAGGVIDVQASWLGNRQYNGATSTQSSLIILPFFVVAVIVSSALAIAIVATAFVKTRHRKPSVPPEPPSEASPQQTQ